MNRMEVVTRNDDDEMWDVAEQVVEREITEGGRIRWVIDTGRTAEVVEEIVPSVVSVRILERGSPE